MDGLDVALLAIGRRGLEMTAWVRRCTSRPLGEAGPRLRAIAAGAATSAGELAHLAHDLAALHVAAIRELAGDEPVHLIALHGQTLVHAPPVSWQLASAAPVARALRAPVVFDLRAADLAGGGQGAPITPLADWVLLRGGGDETRAVLNLGGFCNYTLLPRADAPTASGVSSAVEEPPDRAIGRVRGGDVCACNHVLDGIARRCFDEPFDEGGRRAAAGRVLEEPRAELVALLRRQAGAGRALGPGDEARGWIERYADSCRGEDLARIACDAIAAVAGEGLAAAAGGAGVDRVLVAGGSAANGALMEALKAHLAVRVERTDAHGVPASHREAAAMAVLGALCEDRVPITLPAVTGVSSPPPRSGAWVFP